MGNQNIQIKSKMMTRPIMPLIFVLLIARACTQAAPTVMQLKQVYGISLAANNVSKFQLTIPDKIPSNQSLFISGYSLINDPFQQPILKITSDGYNLACQSQSNDLNEVCSVPYANIKPGQKFMIQVKCIVNCNVRLVAYFSETVQLDINEQIQISTEDAPIEKLLKIYVPTDLQFTQINLVTNVLNRIEVQSGVQMYVKCGKNGVYPTKQSHDNLKIIQWGEAKAAIIRKDIDFKVGSSIYVLLSIGAHTTISFQSRIITKGTRYLQLNQIYYDHIQSSAKQLYIIDLSSFTATQLQKPVIVQFIQFSGSADIEVSLSDQFKSEQLIPQSASSWVRFFVTPEMMKSQEFKKMIYVRVSTDWAASYSLHARVKVNQFDSLEEDLTEFIEVRPNDIGVIVYRHFQSFDENTTSKTYDITVENQGDVDADIKVYTCQNASTCGYDNITNTNFSSPSYKQLQTQSTRQSIRVQYTANDCFNYTSGQVVCSHIITLVPKDRKKTGKYAVTVLGERHIIQLIQGNPHLDYTEKQTYKFYYFYLPKGTQQIVEIFFFVNTLDGNVKLYSSRDVAKPTLNDSSNQKVKTGSENISYKNYQAQPGTYYLTVYATQFSDYVINVIVRRKNNSPSSNMGSWRTPDVFSQKVTSTQVELLDGLAQSFDLQKGTDLATFRFKAMGLANITLIVTQIIGKVQTTITRESNHKKFVCQQNYCDFESMPGQSFFIEVKGESQYRQRFTIVYKQTKQCYKFPIGTPVYVELDKKDTECLEVIIKNIYPIQISNSLTNLQLLNKDTEVVIEFETNTTYVMTRNSHVFTAENLAANCPPNKQNDCKIKIKFISFERQVSLQSIVQGIDMSMTLYDGVVQKMEIVTSPINGRFFRYPVNEDDGIEIFLNSQSYSDYAIYAKLVEAYQSKMIDKYPNINDTDKYVWKVNSSHDSPQLTLLPISKTKIKKAIDEKKIKMPWLLISIYSSTNNSEFSLFTIEVTQRQRTLREGQQQIGFIEPNEIVSYEVYPTRLSLLSVRSLYNLKCIKLLDGNKKEIGDDVYIEQPRSIPLTYYIKAQDLQSCMYQISLQDYQDNIITVSEGFPTRVVAEYQEVAYLLYYHNRNSSFRIYQFVQAGMSLVYATPLNPTQLSSGLRNVAESLPLSSYEYKEGVINNLQIQAKENSTSYCYNCYYLIAIKGQPSVQEDVVIVKEDTPVTIKQHSIVDSYLDPAQNETFIYYAGPDTKFNLSIDVIYGRVTVTVKNYINGPQGKTIKIQSVANSMVTIPISQLGSSTQTRTTDSFNQKYKYRIEVQGIQKSLYHLQIIKYEDSFRIAQGMVSKITMPASGTIKLEFDNLIDRGDITLNIQSNVFNYNPIWAVVSYHQFDQPKYRASTISSTQNTVGSLTTLNFNSLKGHYIVTLRNSLTTAFDFVVQMPRPGLTQLRAGHNSVADHQTIYEIFIQEDSYAIIEVFGCQGNIKVRGSTSIYGLLKGGNYKQEINLLHENIGGHFVVTTPANVSGQYFIRVQNKQYEADINSKISGITFMVRYRLSNKNQKNPYNALDATSYDIRIDHSSSKENLTLNFSSIKSTDPQIIVKVVSYIFVIGTSHDDIKNYMLCATKKDTKHLTYALISNSIEDKLQLNVSKIQVLKKMKQQDLSYIGLVALVEAEQKDGASFSNLVFVYEPGFLGKLRKETVMTASGFFQIMFIIFTVVGACVVLYALLLQLIRVWRGYSSTNDLIQEASQEHNPGNMKSSQFQISNQAGLKNQQASHN